MNRSSDVGSARRLQLANCWRDSTRPPRARQQSQTRESETAKWSVVVFQAVHLIVSCITTRAKSVSSFASRGLKELSSGKKTKKKVLVFLASTQQFTTICCRTSEQDISASYDTTTIARHRKTNIFSSLTRWIFQDAATAHFVF